MLRNPFLLSCLRDSAGVIGSDPAAVWLVEDGFHPVRLFRAPIGALREETAHKRQVILSRKAGRVPQRAQACCDTLYK